MWFGFQVCIIIPDSQSSCEFEKIFGQRGDPLDSEKVGKGSFSGPCRGFRFVVFKQGSDEEPNKWPS